MSMPELSGPSAPPRILHREEMHTTHDLRPTTGGWSFECVICGKNNAIGDLSLAEPCAEAVGVVEAI